MRETVAAIVTAAGNSVRMSGGIKKEYQLLPGAFDSNGKPLSVLGAAVCAFAALERVSMLVVTVPPHAPAGEADARQALPQRLLLGDKPLYFVPGGETRRASVYNALSMLQALPPDYVLIHDGSRPWVSGALIESVLDACILHKAAIPALFLTETPKELDGKGFIKRHLKRAAVAAAQTPQGFAFPQILAAHAQAVERSLNSGSEYTDDAEIWGEFVGDVAVIPGDILNRKITFPDDLK
jgi:2-C-methyl-D-erythritol 4-phosphate cytidylyltransferase/2-C-methyl-D-erythritol 4-phosphate cytidylyltransferase/2-C-methyl-D-erythritol 2,4-cyclodiphosphate synthase